MDQVVAQALHLYRNIAEEESTVTPSITRAIALFKPGAELSQAV
jgi:hypothetical protein